MTTCFIKSFILIIFLSSIAVADEPEIIEYRLTSRDIKFPKYRCVKEYPEFKCPKGTNTCWGPQYREEELPLLCSPVEDKKDGEI